MRQATMCARVTGEFGAYCGRAVCRYPALRCAIPTPRGPNLSIRLTPDQRTAWSRGAGAGFDLRSIPNSISLSLWAGGTETGSLCASP